MGVKMLVFNRPSFRSGVMIVRVMVDAEEKSFALLPSDKGKTFDFGTARDAILAKYPAFFTIPA